MGQYLVLRLGHSLLTLLVVLVIVFTLTRLTGDPITLYAPIEATQADIERIKTEFGLNDPIPLQFARFLGGAVRGDFGRSFRTSQPAMSEVMARLPNTLQLAVVALLISMSVAIPVGMLSAVKKGGWFDSFGKVVALIGQATPNFWLGLMMIFFFSVRLHWLPTGGKGGLENLVLPALTLGSLTMAASMRLTRSSMLDVMSSEYVVVARAKGLSEWVVVIRHGFRNALIPVVTILGLQMGRMIAGSVIVEMVFAWPGMGRLAIQSINSSDYPVVQASIIITAASIILANLTVDILYAYIDPRIRYGRSG